MHERLLFFIFISSVYCVGETSDPSLSPLNPQVADPIPEKCQDPQRKCSDLSNLCLNCEPYDRITNCIYGEWLNVSCTVPDKVQCAHERGLYNHKECLCKYDRGAVIEVSNIGPPNEENHPHVVKKARCLFCYQTEMWEQTCYTNKNKPNSCTAIQTPTLYYKTNCTVNSDVMCIGNRSFQRKVKCNWTRGHKWSTALLLSITLGGFGADRFYLGHWQEGIGKLFSFGGLGVWTLVDVLLIAIRYLGPADGSYYV